MTGVCEDHAFLMKRGAESRERASRPQQRVLQKADALAPFGNQTAHRNLNRPFTKRAGTPALPTAHTQNTRSARMAPVTNRITFSRLRTHKTRARLAWPLSLTELRSVFRG